MAGDDTFRRIARLNAYPTGSYRWGLLLLTLSAQMIGLYDLSFGGLLPLFISSLHFSAKHFSYFLIFAVVLSGVAAAAGGPLADRHGRDDHRLVPGRDNYFDVL